MKSNAINKLIVAPQIVVYKNLLPDAAEILEAFKDSQNNPVQNSLFKGWDSWSPNHNTPGDILKVRVKDVSFEPEDSDSDIVIKQKAIVSKIYEAFDYAKEDFLQEWAGKGSWPDIITNWDISDQRVWDNHEIDILSYGNIEDQNIKHNPKDGVYSLPMNYHVDANPSDIYSKGTRLAVTITMYLNDDYEGGEISFYNSEDDQIYNYKPVQGDVTVFPSFQPFYHGVLPMNGNKRYLIRSFFMYNYNGSDEWHKEKANYSEEEWEVLEKQRRKDSFMRYDHLLCVLQPGDPDPRLRYKTVYTKNNIIVIN